MSNFTTENCGSYYLAKAIGKSYVPRRSNFWFKFLMGSILFFGLLYPITTKAESTDKAAHFGVSYVLTASFYGLYKGILNRDCRADRQDTSTPCPLTPGERVGAAAFAAATSFMIGIMKEAGDRELDGGDLLANGLGSATAMGSIILFEF